MSQLYGSVIQKVLVIWIITPRVQTDGPNVGGNPPVELTVFQRPQLVSGPNSAGDKHQNLSTVL